MLLSVCSHLDGEVTEFDYRCDRKFLNIGTIPYVFLKVRQFIVKHVYVGTNYILDQSYCNYVLHMSLVMSSPGKMKEKQNVLNLVSPLFA